MGKEQLQGRDYEVAVDKSGSMNMKVKSGKSRFLHCAEQAVAVAHIAAEFDTDGITVVTFGNDEVTVLENQTPDKILDAFKGQPKGGTPTHLMLKNRFDAYFARKAAGNVKPLSLIVFTDGAPDSAALIKEAIVEATNKMDKDEEIAVSIFQVGDDTAVADFLTDLDDNLMTVNKAKFDIVDCKTEKEQGTNTIEELLLAGIND